MDLSIKDLIFKPETAGPGILRPSVQGVGETASLAAFNELLGGVGQIHQNSAVRPSEREVPPVPVDSLRGAQADDHQPAVSPSRQREPADRPYADDQPDGQVESLQRESANGTKREPETPAVNPENNAPDSAAPETTNTAATNTVDGTPGQPATIPIQQLNAVATAAVTAAHAIEGGPAGAAPGEAVANAVTSAVAGAAINRTSAPESASASTTTPTDLPEPAKALGLKSIVGSTGSAGASDEEGLAIQGRSTSTAAIAAAASGGARSVKGMAAAAAVEVLPEVNVPAEISLQKNSVFAQSRSPIAPGIFVAQEVANSQAAVFQFQAGDAEAGSIGKPGTGIPSAGAQATPQMMTTQSTGVETLPSPASAAAMEPVVGQPTSTPTSSGSPTSAIFGAGPNTMAASAPGASASTTTAMRAPQPLPVPVDQFAVHIARAAANGSDHINIKLKPASLGQVEVKLEVTHDGRIAAVVSAERVETLDMLQRDARALERALQEAGLKTDSNSLQFNLRGENGSAQVSNPMNTQAAEAPSADVGDQLEAPVELVAGVYKNSRASIGGLDIRV